MPGEEGLVAAGLAAAACINLDLQKVGGGGVSSVAERRQGKRVVGGFGEAKG